MNEANVSAQLRDIKPLLEIPDSSYYVYWGTISFTIVMLLLVLVYVLRKLWKNRKINLAKGYLLAMKNIDWKESKKCAYKATHYARLLATDEKRKALFLELKPMLEQYKYKKEVDSIDADTLEKFNTYIQVAHESI